MRIRIRTLAGQKHADPCGSGSGSKTLVEGKPQYLKDVYMLEFQFDDEHYRIVVVIKKGKMLSTRHPDHEIWGSFEIFLN